MTVQKRQIFYLSTQLSYANIKCLQNPAWNKSLCIPNNKIRLQNHSLGVSSSFQAAHVLSSLHIFLPKVRLEVPLKNFPSKHHQPSPKISNRKFTPKTHQLPCWATPTGASSRYLHDGFSLVLSSVRNCLYWLLAKFLKLAVTWINRGTSFGVPVRILPSSGVARDWLQGARDWLVSFDVMPPMKGHVYVYPIGSMYAIYGNIYHQYTPNVSIYIYTIHGSYGYYKYH